jgi:hypothetical protein
MIFLILSVSAATVFGQLMKWAVVRRTDLYVVAAANYVAASGLALAVGLGGGESWPQSASAAWVTIPGGLFFVASFVTWLWSMERGGLSVSTVVFQLSAAVPVIAAMLIWRELPQWWQAFGLVVLIPALVLLSHRSAAAVKSEKPWSPGLVLTMFLTTGLALVVIKLKPHLHLEHVNFLYFHWVFGMAAVGAIAMCVATRARITAFGVLLGVAIGLSNLLTVMALTWALKAGAPGYIVFPVQAGGNIVTATVLGLTAWGESFHWRNAAGVGCALVAIVLLTA